MILRVFLFVSASAFVFCQDCSTLKSTLLVYGNGIRTTSEDATIDRQELDERLRPVLLQNGINPDSILPSQLAYDAVYVNPNGLGGVGGVINSGLQFFQAALQAKLQYTQEFWYWWSNAGVAPQWFNQIEQDIAVAIGTGTSALLQPDLLKHINDIYRPALTCGQTVIVLAHSQGNLYVNQAFDILFPSTSSPGIDRFKVIAVATPASRVPGGGHYNTLKRDPIWALPYLVGASSLLWNEDNGPYLGNDYFSSQTFFDWSFHDFTASYLAGVKGDASGNKILSDIISALPKTALLNQQDFSAASRPSWYSDNWYQLGTGFSGTLQSLSLKGYVDDSLYFASHLWLDEYLDSNYAQLSHTFTISDNAPFTSSLSDVIVAGLNIPLQPTKYYRLRTSQDYQNRSVILLGTSTLGLAMWNAFSNGIGRVENYYTFYPYLSSNGVPTPTAGFVMSAGNQTATEGQTLNVSAPFGVGATVTLDASTRSSGANGSTITGWQWTVNGVAVASASSLSYAFTPGTSTVSLTVTDSRGAKSLTVQGSIVVGPTIGTLMTVSTVTYVQSPSSPYAESFQTTNGGSLFSVSFTNPYDGCEAGIYAVLYQGADPNTATLVATSSFNNSDGTPISRSCNSGSGTMASVWSPAIPLQANQSYNIRIYGLGGARQTYSGPQSPSGRGGWTWNGTSFVLGTPHGESDWQLGVNYTIP